MADPRKTSHPDSRVTSRVTARATSTTSSAAKTSPSKSTSISRGVCERISQWMWSGWACESNQSASNGSASHQPYQSDPTDCKACREWHVPCDHARPQCDHCYQQQLLCFYTNPTPKQKPTRKGPDVIVPRIREPTPRKRL